MASRSPEQRNRDAFRQLRRDEPKRWRKVGGVQKAQAQAQAPPRNETREDFSRREAARRREEAKHVPPSKWEVFLSSTLDGVKQRWLDDFGRDSAVGKAAGAVTGLVKDHVVPEISGTLLRATGRDPDWKPKRFDAERESMMWAHRIRLEQDARLERAASDVEALERVRFHEWSEEGRFKAVIYAAKFGRVPENERAAHKFFDELVAQEQAEEELDPAAYDPYMNELKYMRPDPDRTEIEWFRWTQVALARRQYENQFEPERGFFNRSIRKTTSFPKDVLWPYVIAPVGDLITNLYQLSHIHLTSGPSAGLAIGADLKKDRDYDLLAAARQWERERNEKHGGQAPDIEHSPLSNLVRSGVRLMGEEGYGKNYSDRPHLPQHREDMTDLTPEELELVFDYAVMNELAPDQAGREDETWKDIAKDMAFYIVVDAINIIDIAQFGRWATVGKRVPLHPLEKAAQTSQRLDEVRGMRQAAEESTSHIASMQTRWYGMTERHLTRGMNQDIIESATSRGVAVAATRLGRQTEVLDAIHRGQDVMDALPKYTRRLIEYTQKPMWAPRNAEQLEMANIRLQQSRHVTESRMTDETLAIVRSEAKTLLRGKGDSTVEAFFLHLGGPDVGKRIEGAQGVPLSELLAMFPPQQRPRVEKLVKKYRDMVKVWRSEDIFLEQQVIDGIEQLIAAKVITIDDAYKYLSGTARMHDEFDVGVDVARAAKALKARKGSMTPVVFDQEWRAFLKTNRLSELPDGTLVARKARRFRNDPNLPKKYEGKYIEPMANSWGDSGHYIPLSDPFAVRAPGSTNIWEVANYQYQRRAGTMTLSRFRETFITGPKKGLFKHPADGFVAAIDQRASNLARREARTAAVMHYLRQQYATDGKFFERVPKDFLTNLEFVASGGHDLPGPLRDFVRQFFDAADGSPARMEMLQDAFRVIRDHTISEKDRTEILHRVLLVLEQQRQVVRNGMDMGQETKDALEVTLGLLRRAAEGAPGGASDVISRLDTAIEAGMREAGDGGVATRVPAYILKRIENGGLDASALGQDIIYVPAKVVLEEFPKSGAPFADARRYDSGVVKSGRYAAGEIRRETKPARTAWDSAHSTYQRFIKRQAGRNLKNGNAPGYKAMGRADEGYKAALNDEYHRLLKEEGNEAVWIVTRQGVGPTDGKVAPDDLFVLRRGDDGKTYFEALRPKVSKPITDYIEERALTGYGELRDELMALGHSILVSDVPVPLGDAIRHAIRSTGYSEGERLAARLNSLDEMVKGDVGTARLFDALVELADASEEAEAFKSAVGILQALKADTLAGKGGDVTLFREGTELTGRVQAAALAEDLSEATRAEQTLLDAVERILLQDYAFDVMDSSLRGQTPVIPRHVRPDRFANQGGVYRGPVQNVDDLAHRAERVKAAALYVSEDAKDARKLLDSEFPPEQFPVLRQVLEGAIEEHPELASVKVFSDLSLEASGARGREVSLGSGSWKTDGRIREEMAKTYAKPFASLTEDEKYAWTLAHELGHMLGGHIAMGRRDYRLLGGPGSERYRLVHKLLRQNHGLSPEDADEAIRVGKTLEDGIEGVSGHIVGSRLSFDDLRNAYRAAYRETVVERYADDFARATVRASQHGQTRAVRRLRADLLDIHRAGWGPDTSFLRDAVLPGEQVFIIGNPTGPLPDGHVALSALQPPEMLSHWDVGKRAEVYARHLDTAEAKAALSQITFFMDSRAKRAQVIFPTDPKFPNQRSIYHKVLESKIQDAPVFDRNVGKTGWSKRAEYMLKSHLETSTGRTPSEVLESIDALHELVGHAEVAAGRRQRLEIITRWQQEYVDNVGRMDETEFSAFMKARLAIDEGDLSPQNLFALSPHDFEKVFGARISDDELRMFARGVASRPTHGLGSAGMVSPSGIDINAAMGRVPTAGEAFGELLNPLDMTDRLLTMYRGAIGGEVKSLLTMLIEGSLGAGKRMSAQRFWKAMRAKTGIVDVVDPNTNMTLRSAVGEAGLLEYSLNDLFLGIAKRSDDFKGDSFASALESFSAVKSQKYERLVASTSGLSGGIDDVVKRAYGLNVDEVFGAHHNKAVRLAESLDIDVLTETNRMRWHAMDEAMQEGRKALRALDEFEMGVYQLAGIEADDLVKTFDNGMLSKHFGEEGASIFTDGVRARLSGQRTKALRRYRGKGSVANEAAEAALRLYDNFNYKMRVAVLLTGAFPLGNATDTLVKNIVQGVPPKHLKEFVTGYGRALFSKNKSAKGAAKVTARMDDIGVRLPRGWHMDDAGARSLAMTDIGLDSWGETLIPIQGTFADYVQNQDRARRQGMVQKAVDAFMEKGVNDLELFSRQAIFRSAMDDGIRFRLAKELPGHAGDIDRLFSLPASQRKQFLKGKPKLKKAIDPLKERVTDLSFEQGYQKMLFTHFDYTNVSKAQRDLKRFFMFPLYAVNNTRFWGTFFASHPQWAYRIWRAQSEDDFLRPKIGEHRMDLRYLFSSNKFSTRGMASMQSGLGGAAGFVGLDFTPFMYHALHNLGFVETQNYRNGIPLLNLLARGSAMSPFIRDGVGPAGVDIPRWADYLFADFMQKQGMPRPSESKLDYYNDNFTRNTIRQAARDGTPFEPLDYAEAEQKVATRQLMYDLVGFFGKVYLKHEGDDSFLDPRMPVNEWEDMRREAFFGSFGDNPHIKGDSFGNSTDLTFSAINVIKRWREDKLDEVPGYNSRKRAEIHKLFGPTEDTLWDMTPGSKKYQDHADRLMQIEKGAANAVIRGYFELMDMWTMRLAEGPQAGPARRDLKDQMRESLDEYAEQYPIVRELESRDPRVQAWQEYKEEYLDAFIEEYMAIGEISDWRVREQERERIAELSRRAAADYTRRKRREGYAVLDNEFPGLREYFDANLTPQERLINKFYSGDYASYRDYYAAFQALPEWARLIINQYRVEKGQDPLRPPGTGSGRHGGGKGMAQWAGRYPGLAQMFNTDYTGFEHWWAAYLALPESEQLQLNAYRVKRGKAPFPIGDAAHDIDWDAWRKEYGVPAPIRQGDFFGVPWATVDAFFAIPAQNKQARKEFLEDHPELEAAFEESRQEKRRKKAEQRKALLEEYPHIRERMDEWYEESMVYKERAQPRPPQVSPTSGDEPERYSSGVRRPGERRGE